MLPRSQRSIFHLGEEGGDEHLGADDDGHGVESTIRFHHQRLGRRGRDDAGGGGGAVVVGLQIVLAQRHQLELQHRDARPCRIVLKQMVWPPQPPPPAAQGRHRRRRPCGFLTACSLCRRELSPDKDVYMYRGDQGFCSEECRWQQILKDEAREQEAMVKKERRGKHQHQHQHHHHRLPRPTAAIRGCGSPRRLLAVA